MVKKRGAQRAELFVAQTEARRDREDIITQLLDMCTASVDRSRSCRTSCLTLNKWPGRCLVARSITRRLTETGKHWLK